MALTNITGIGTATESLLFSYNIKSIYDLYMFIKTNKYSIEGFYEGVGLEKVELKTSQNIHVHGLRILKIQVQLRRKINLKTT